MRAIVITHPGGPEVLDPRDVPQPEPAPDEVLVRVHATAVNRADLLQRQGRYPAPPGVPPDIPGLEFAGEVEARSARASAWKPGQRVFGLAGGGTYAEFVIAHERTLAEIPANLSYSEAAAVPEAFITAHDALWRQAALRPGETVLITAVGSGVGLAAVQLARAMNAVPFGTSRTAEKIEKARELGLEGGVTIDNPAQLAGFAQQATGGRGFNVIIDLVGGPYVGAELAALATHGRVVVVGTVAGGHSEIELRHLMSRRATLIGTVLRARALEEKIAVTQAFANEVVPLLARRVLRPTIDSEFPLAEAAAAHERVDSNATFGKVVLKV